MMQLPPIETEIAALAARYGAPARISAPLAGAPFSPLTLADRYGEVCMVVRRPNGKLITAIKDFYPPGAFRLLTGGVSHGERIETALLREVAEETGLEVIVRRFLAVITYHPAQTNPDGSAPIRWPFATFAFLLDEVGGVLGAQDAGERIATFREISIVDLPALADTLDAAPHAYDPEINGSWRDWGRFRAVVHRVVFEALQSI